MNKTTMLRSFTRNLAIISCIALAISPCAGQTFSASITGIVADPSGGGIAGATIEIRDSATNDLRRAVSGSEGSYEFTNMLPGTYEITARAAGFKTFVRRDVVLSASTAASLNLTLEVGATEQRVEVTGEAVLLDTESANHSVSLESNLVSSLPTSTRSPLNFVFALAGTTTAQGGMTSPGSTVDQNFSMFGLQGGRSGNAQILIDGAPATALDWGGLMVSPLIDSVQELQVTQNTYDTQYAKAGAGIVSIISKGGSNSFHGTAYNFLRNDNLDANTWQNNRFEAPRGEFKRNQFGGNISGPIWKRHNLFFFAAYEGLRQPETQSQRFTVPTELERQGDFSQSFNAEGALLPDLQSLHHAQGRWR